MLAWLIACGPGDFVDGASLPVPAGAEETAALAIPALPTVPLTRPTLPQGTDLAQCYVRVDGTAVCIGFDDAYGKLSPPPGVYVAAAQSGMVGYGLTEEGNIVGWGAAPLPRLGSFVTLVGGAPSCALSATGDVDCEGTSYPGPFARVATDPSGPSGACMLSPMGQATCVSAKLAPPPGAFIDVAVGDKTACAIRTNGALQCWGDNTKHLAEPPEGVFVGVAITAGKACAWSADGSAQCWGNHGPVEAPPRVAALGFARKKMTLVQTDNDVMIGGWTKEHLVEPWLPNHIRERHTSNDPARVDEPVVPAAASIDLLGARPEAVDPCAKVESCCAVLRGTSASKDCRDLQALLRKAPSPAERTRACEQFTSLMATLPNAPAGCR